MLPTPSAPTDPVATQTRSARAPRRAARDDAASADAATRALADLLPAALRPARLSPAALAALAARAIRHEVPAGTLVLRRGEDCTSLWLLERGCASLGRHDALQRWQPTCSVRGGDWIDASSAWLGAPLAEGALAETACTVWAFAVRDLEHLGVLHPGLPRAWLTLLAARVRRLTEEKQVLLSQEVLARCALWLLDGLRESSDGRTVLLTQRKRSIAAQLGATPETFSRTLRELRELGAIEVQGYRIVVLDAAALTRLVDGRGPTR